MITEKKLQYFIEVCKTENISSAARNLFIAQPALSKTIQELGKNYTVHCLTGRENISF